MSEPSDKGIRLNKFLASCGVGSRRSSESLIREGRVEINGEVILDLSTRVRQGDHVRCDGRLLRTQADLTLALNKPRGYLCTKSDPQGRKTIYDLLPSKFNSLHYVGRLDLDSAGLLILTSSGELTEKLTHPRYHVEKEYLVQLDRPLESELTSKLTDGIHLAEGLARAEQVSFDSRRRLRIVLTQGFNRQIRRMLSKLGHKVRHLERIRIGEMTLPSLSTGEYRILSHKEIELAAQSGSGREND